MIQMRPLVSVVIPNFNYGQYLGQAIESVLAQGYRPLDVVVVDDGSTDHSRDVLRRYEGRLRVIGQPRQGVSVARNRGVRESRGELVAFLDADDVWLPGKLERQVERLRVEPALGLVHCAAQLIDAAGRILSEVTEGVAGWVTADLLQFRRSGVVTGGSGSVLPRAVFEETGGFDPRLSTSADWDFFYRVGRHRPFGFIAEPLVQMRIHQANMRSNIRAMEHDMLLAFEKAFQDPALEIRRLRRKAYGRLHMVLAGSFFRAGRWERGVAYAGRSVVAWPPAGVRMASRLARRLRWPAAEPGPR